MSHVERGMPRCSDPDCGRVIERPKHLVLVTFAGRTRAYHTECSRRRRRDLSGGQPLK